MIQYLCVALLCIFIPFSISLLSDGMIGPGRWLVINIQKCPDWQKYPIRIDIVRRKVNRTHDGFSGFMELDMDFDDHYSVRMDICKHVDGGCKPYQLLTDHSGCNFIEKYAKENVKDCLAASGLNESCPIPKGKHVINNYVFNYEELPGNSIYGLFGVKIQTFEKSQEISCVDMTISFEAKRDDDE
ncbi:hypothetical protein ABMA27_003335 [Loxostege sticticalis]|uniref:MD-2-related lipid-recognition domain-containing protein n=1 Tax=Loxostege sticticalis TaxID=481309 RepID=A0ABR3HSS5_LOXSC